LRAWVCHTLVLLTPTLGSSAVGAQASTAINDKLSDAGRDGEPLAPVELRTFPVEGYAPATSVLVPAQSPPVRCPAPGGVTQRVLRRRCRRVLSVSREAIDKLGGCVSCLTSAGRWTGQSRSNVGRI
jgi:hypothetical protein